MHRPSRRFALLATAATAVVLAVAPAVSAAPYPINIPVDADDGHGRIEAPGLACEDGGEGAYWHYAYSDELPGGLFSQLPLTVRTNLDLHSDEVRYPNNNANPLPPNPNASLLGTESTIGFSNSRGTVRMRAQSGAPCAASTLAFDGSNASGSGTWAVESGTGAYEDITGNGTFTIVNAEVNPGADNDLRINLVGTVNVLQPNLDVELLGTFWSNLGLDYLLRRVSATYRITNTGPGYAYNASLASTPSLTSGVAPLGPTPQPLGDLLPGESEIVTVKYQMTLSLLPAPCLLIILNCAFDSRVNVAWSDALDVQSTPSEVIAHRAPLLPPPL